MAARTLQEVDLTTVLLVTPDIASLDGLNDSRAPILPFNLSALVSCGCTNAHFMELQLRYKVMFDLGEE